ncbi:hypothetical protein CsSME_00026638 [Camellia sinensis var. sinensis]
MHIRGPPLKGKNVPWPFVAFVIPSENLSGLNSNASSPQISGSCWIAITGNVNSTPAGRTSSPSLVGLCIARRMWAAGGYNLRTSYRIMVICR